MHNDAIVRSINGLIETSKDGQHGFRTCSERAESQQIKEQLVARAKDCEWATAELQRLVIHYGGDAETEGSATGSMHRMWITLKGAVGGKSDLMVLEEAERGEDRALARYREVLLTDELPADVRAVVDSQLQSVKQHHDQIRQMRDLARAAG